MTSDVREELGYRAATPQPPRVKATPPPPPEPTKKPRFVPTGDESGDQRGFLMIPHMTVLRAAERGEPVADPSREVRLAKEQCLRWGLIYPIGSLTPAGAAALAKKRSQKTR